MLPGVVGLGAIRERPSACFALVPRQAVAQTLRRVVPQTFARKIGPWRIVVFTVEIGTTAWALVLKRYCA